MKSFRDPEFNLNANKSKKKIVTDCHVNATFSNASLGAQLSKIGEAVEATHRLKYTGFEGFFSNAAQP